MSLSTRTSTFKAALATTLATITLDDGSTFAAYTWVPTHPDTMPCAAMWLPELTRVEPEDAEFIISKRSFRIDMDLDLYVGLVGDQKFSQEQAEALVMSVIDAVDADASVGGTLEDAKVTRATGGLAQDGQYLIYETKFSATLLA